MVKKDINLLIISYTFPPIPYGGTYRTLRLCKRLSEMGIKLHVLTIKRYDDIPNDDNLTSDVPSSVTVHRTCTIDPWRKYQSWKKRRTKTKGFRYFNKIMSSLLRLISIPDHMVLWVPFAVFKGMTIIRNHNIKKIYISSPPNSSQLIGLLLKLITKVKWIADLRDPIIGNIAEVNLIRPSDLFSVVERRIRISYEKLIINSTDNAIANTETQRKELIAKYNTNKVYTIRNSFDEDEYKVIDKEKYELFTISHLGSIYGLRKADILFKAIKTLEKKFYPKSLNLNIRFVGLNDKKLENCVHKYGIEKYVKIEYQVAHEEAINIMIKSHLLLVIKAIGENSYGQIPGKFFEYLGTNNRILCLGPEKSELAELIYSLDAGYVIEDNENKLCNVLQKEYKNYLNGIDNSIQRTPLMYEFNSLKMAQKVISLVNDL